jgi:hypothetical protein
MKLENIKFTDFTAKSAGRLTHQLKVYLLANAKVVQSTYTVKQLYHVVDMEEFAKQKSVGIGMINTLTRMYDQMPKKDKRKQHVDQVKEKPYVFGQNSTALDQWEILTQMQNNREVDLDYYRLVRVTGDMAKVVDIRRRKVLIPRSKTKYRNQLSNHRIKIIDGRQFIKIEMDRMVPLERIKGAKKKHLKLEIHKNHHKDSIQRTY